MPLGTFTRTSVESTAQQTVRELFRILDEAERMRGRLAAELAAGTLDTVDFYQGNAAGKANLLGAYDDLHAIKVAIEGGPLPQLDYRRYMNFLV